jgi:hypothetical protein
MTTAGGRDIGARGSSDISAFHPTVMKVSQLLDEKIYYPLYQKDAGRFELSVSGLVSITKVSEKLIPIKVGCATLGTFCLISFLRLVSSNQPRWVLYLIASIDLFRISYNAYGRQYLSLVGKYTLESPQELGRSIMSLFSSGKNAEENFIKKATETVNWNYLADGTISLWGYNQVISSFSLPYVVLTSLCICCRIFLLLLRSKAFSRSSDGVVVSKIYFALI